jgi:hypothetical protein
MSWCSSEDAAQFRGRGMRGVGVQNSRVRGREAFSDHLDFHDRLRKMLDPRVTRRVLANDQASNPSAIDRLPAASGFGE